VLTPRGIIGSSASLVLQASPVSLTLLKNPNKLLPLRPSCVTSGELTAGIRLSRPLAQLKSQLWWCTLVINKAKRMRQEDHEFEASLIQKKKKKKKVSSCTQKPILQRQRIKKKKSQLFSKEL
jgi:hypothetical protein